MDLSQRLDEMELAIHKPSFRKGTGRANEVNYWVFDYPPEKELEVRERVEYLKNKNDRGDDDFELVVFDLYDIIIDFLEKKNFMEMPRYEEISEELLHSARAIIDADNEMQRIKDKIGMFHEI